MKPITVNLSRRIRQTPFTPRVEALGVKGYTIYDKMLLATQFESVEADYWHLRRHVQLWDVSCERQIELKGPDAAELAQLMTPRNLTKMKVGKCYYAPLIDHNGGIVNDPIILKLADDRFWLSIADSDVELFAKGIAMGRGLDVEVFEADIYPLAIQGPKSDDVAALVFGEEIRGLKFFNFGYFAFQGHDFLIARSGWSKQGGFEIYVDNTDLALPLWDAIMEAGHAFQIGPGCPNLLERIEGGLFSFGNDFTPENNPLEGGLKNYCDLENPIEYIGREALLKVASSTAPKEMFGVIFEGETCPPCVEPWDVMSEDGEFIGKMTSACYSPAMNGNIGLAILTVEKAEVGSTVTVQTGEGSRIGKVSRVPFDVPPIQD